MDLPERAIPGTHQEVLTLFLKRYPTAARVLDLGAGTGAFVQRLQDAGYSNVVASDIDGSGYLASVPFVQLDLNREFAPSIGRLFDVVTAIEVIEHLESPAHFLRQCGRLLAPGGEIVLTTPNIESLPGRFRFFVSGKLRMFDGIIDSTHITPVNSFLFEQHTRRNGFRIVIDKSLFRYWPRSRQWVRVMGRFVAPFLSGAVYGELHLFVLCRESAPEPTA